MEKEMALVPIEKKKSSAELVLDLAKNDGNVALVAVLERMTQLETAHKSAMSKLELANKTVKEIIVAARDLERNYTIPGPKRFKRVVRLRKALDDLEDCVRKGHL